VTFTSRRTVLVAAGALALLVGVVATFPARLALSWFAPPDVAAWGVEGTVWRGRAAGLVLREQSLGAFSWQAQVARVALLQPAWDLEMRRQDGYARGRLGFSRFGRRVSISNLDASMELGTLPQAIVPAGVAGQARISLERLVIEQGWPVAIVGRAEVSDLELPGVIMALGPFEFRFPDQSDPLLAEIRSTGGPLEVDGRLELPARGRWRFSADLAPGENPPRELVDGLQFVGEDIGNGRRRLMLSSEP
jgi:general secretion pathway protein N